jgi:chromosome segregation ATPase
MNEVKPPQIPIGKPEPPKKFGGNVKVAAAILLFIVLCGIIFTQFRTISLKKQEIATLKQENLLGEDEQKKLNSYINEITGTINEIGDKLQDVRKKQVQISGMISHAENNATQKSKIINDISVIEDQLKKDKKDIAALRDKMNKSNLRIKVLDQMVANLQDEITKNEKTIAEMRETIGQKDVVIKNTRDTLNSTQDTLSYTQKNLQVVSTELDKTTQILDETRKTAYFAMGTEKELIGKKILEKSGGFLQRKNIDLAKDFDSALFTRINIAQKNEFEINCPAKNVKLIPSRSETSYQIEEAGKNASLLKVMNTEQFWKIQYLVIITKS